MTPCCDYANFYSRKRRARQPVTLRTSEEISYTARGTMTTASKLKPFLDKTAIIGIVGMGYVGMPLALAAAAAGFRIVGFDIEPEKVADINSGKSYIKHIASQDIAAAVKGGRLRATDRFETIRDVDAIVI